MVIGLQGESGSTISAWLIAQCRAGLKIIGKIAPALHIKKFLLTVSTAKYMYQKTQRHEILTDAMTEPPFSIYQP